MKFNVEFENHVRKVPFFKNVIKEIDEKPRICNRCGCVENVHNVILSYDGEFICDDCVLLDPRFDDWSL